MIVEGIPSDGIKDRFIKVATLEQHLEAEVETMITS